LFLRRDAAAYGKVRLHEALFTLYEYRWVVQDIADYTTRTLIQNSHPSIIPIDSHVVIVTAFPDEGRA
jgi:hypothetical protein